jgi:hypothetical protein
MSQVVKAHTLKSSYLLDVISGRIKKLSNAKIEIAEFAIEHKVGKPKTQLTLPTDSQGRTIIPYSQLIILATEPEKDAQDTPEPLEI